MRLRIKLLLVVASTLAVSAGCEEPQQMVPVAPPGFDQPRVPTGVQAQEAQALGEQAAGAATPPAQTKVTPSVVADSPPTPIGQPTTTKSGLTYETLRPGAGQTAKSGDSVEMHYTGTLADGTKFDSSFDRGRTYPITLGTGGVIRGWDEGLPGMKVGEKRKLTIPPELGYRDRPNGKIPANATLIFEVELIKINE